MNLQSVNKILLPKKLMPAAMWAFFILVICGFPGDQIPSIELLNRISFDKFVHSGIFTLQTILLLAFFYHHHLRKERWLILMDVVFFGLMIEFMQTYFFINRFGEWVDVLANSIGVLIGYTYIEWVSGKKKLLS